MFLQLTDLSYK